MLTHVASPIGIEWKFFLFLACWVVNGHLMVWTTKESANLAGRIRSGATRQSDRPACPALRRKDAMPMAQRVHAGGHGPRSRNMKKTAGQADSRHGGQHYWDRFGAWPWGLGRIGGALGERQDSKGQLLPGSFRFPTGYILPLSTLYRAPLRSDLSFRITLPECTSPFSIYTSHNKRKRRLSSRFHT